MKRKRKVKKEKHFIIIKLHNKIMKTLVPIYFLVFTIILATISKAFLVHSEQSYVKIIIPENSSTKYLLFIINDEIDAKVINLSCRGDCEILTLGWNIKEIPPYYYSILPINITVPSGIATYYFEIWGNEKPLSKIIVETTLPQATILDLISTTQKIKELEKLENRIYEIVNESTKDIIERINESSTKTKKDIEEELKTKLEEMKEKIKSEIGTGYAIANTSEKSILFIFGLICGALIIYLIELKRNRSMKSIKQAREGIALAK
ncbi:MAG: hypothetical protein QXJ96_02685 [Candidatus Aenigmatarchaeota archaeon]|nr:hypothetical protein [Candidatus Aenigmarchaeota archaeon]